MKALKARFLVFLALWGAWLVLTAPWSGEEAIAGAAAALLVAVLPFFPASPLCDLRLGPKPLAYSVAFGFVFLKALVLSNLDVAFRVLHPRLPIAPGIVKVKTALKTPLGRLLLANAITLTPGTITVETRGEDLYIHWIKVAAADPEGATEAIVSQFEKYLEVICG
ncbi:MAG: Na+/H+ antiporter subunit E [Spirochaetes bacterium]|nr:Na+/H+ antiporter subunit E [Spirochaetota bacterium]MBU1082004.1 Na+/H+ antiporter subunit E [Spirochaetota bacterium]